MGEIAMKKYEYVNIEYSAKGVVFKHKKTPLLLLNIRY